MWQSSHFDTLLPATWYYITISLWYAIVTLLPITWYYMYHPTVRYFSHTITCYVVLYVPSHCEILQSHHYLLRGTICTIPLWDTSVTPLPVTWYYMYHPSVRYFSHTITCYVVLYTCTAFTSCNLTWILWLSFYYWR